MKTSLALAALLLLPAGALAGRPLSTEDASTLDEKACQVDSWLDRARAGGSVVAAAPACTAFGVEWEAGGARLRDDGRSRTAYAWLHGKHAFRRIDDGPWGVAVVAGLTRFPQRERKSGWGDPYLIVPVSVGLGEDRDTRALLHLNLGTTRLRDEGRNLTLWGVAMEMPASGHLALLAEAFGENSRKPFFRAGLRYAVFDGLALDFSAVTRTGGTAEDRAWSVGIHWEPPSRLP